MLVFFLRYGISSSDLSFLLLHLSKQFFIHSCYNISDSNSTKYSHLFLLMIFYVCCNFTKLFFRIFYVCSMFFLNLYLFIVIKVTKKWSQQQHELTAIPMLIRGLSKMNWYKNPLIWYFLYSPFFAYQMIGLYYSIFFLCYIY